MRYVNVQTWENGKLKEKQRLVKDTEYVPATAGQLREMRENYAEAKYNSLSEEDKADVDVYLERLHNHYVKKGFHPEPSKKFKLDLLMVFGTYLNQLEREK